jgi:hypothetical protein
MEKVGRLLGTLLVLSLIFVACKKDDSSSGKNGGNDSSFNDGFTNGKKPSQSQQHYNCSASEHDGDDDHGNSGHHGKKITICHNGHMITISISAVFHHFKQHGTDLLFNCDPSKGVAYDDIISTLNKIIHDNHLHGNQETMMQRAFNIWYNQYYLTGNWPIPVNTGGGSGGGDPGTGNGGGTPPVDTTPVVVAPTMAICHNGAMINETYPLIFSDFQNGDILFSCDPSTGVFYSDVEGPLLDIIYDYTLDANASDVMYQAFLIWYTDYYLAGNWPPAGGAAGGGGSGDGGSGTGSDSTVVIHN